MNKRRSRFIKALLLIIVFALNMMVSFACSISETVHHSHHPAKNTDKSHHKHEEPKTNGHEHGNAHNHGQDGKEDKDDDSSNCCSGDSIKLQQTDRSLSRGIDVPEQASFPLLYTILLDSELSLVVTVANEFLPQHFRWRLSTIPDVRIAIQSFQI